MWLWLQSLNIKLCRNFWNKSKEFNIFIINRCQFQRQFHPANKYSKWPVLITRKRCYSKFPIAHLWIAQRQREPCSSRTRKAIRMPQWSRIKVGLPFQIYNNLDWLSNNSTIIHSGHCMQWPWISRCRVFWSKILIVSNLIQNKVTQLVQILLSVPYLRYKTISILAPRPNWPT